MYIYLLTRLDDNDADYDQVLGMVVTANSVPEAREFASHHSVKGDEATWLRSTETKCVYVGIAADIYDRPALLLSDLNNG